MSDDYKPLFKTMLVCMELENKLLTDLYAMLKMLMWFSAATAGLVVALLLRPYL